jgi:ABC-type uncharacterized transport system substrate-binding protein
VRACTDPVEQVILHRLIDMVPMRITAAGYRHLGKSIVPLLAALLALVAGQSAADGADAVKVVIAFTPHPLYREMTNGLETAVKEKEWPYSVVELPASDQETGNSPGRTGDPGAAATQPASPSASSQEIRKRLEAAKPTVIVAVGTEATYFALGAVAKVPVVFCMVPNALDAAFLAEGSRHKSRVAGVATDVSPKEQIAWAQKLDEEVKNIGVLYSARTRRTMEALRAAGQDSGITITPIETNKIDFLKAIELLTSNRCDGAIMLPDSDVYNTPTVQRLLLWGLRARKPVWAFSSKIVKAGAFAGWQPKDEAIVSQTIDIVDKIMSGSDVASIGVKYPTKITCSINERSTELIGVSVPDEVLNKVEERFGRN